MDTVRCHNLGNIATLGSTAISTGPMKVINREERAEISQETLPVAQSEENDDRGFPFKLTLIVLASAVLYVMLSACWPKFSRAEVFFSECAREMIATSNYVTPLYHGQGFFDKPILCYWFIIGCFKTFGITHFVARIPSIIASIATLFVTGYACRAIFGTRAALIATMALGTSFMYLSFSALCMSDTMLVLVDTITLTLLYAGLRAGERNAAGRGSSHERENGGAAERGAHERGAHERGSSHERENGTAPKLDRTALWFLAAASMGVGFLTKGPVAVVLPSAFFLAYLFIEKQLKTIKLKHIVLGALAFCIIGAPWFYLAYQANGIEAITYFFIRENVQRFAGATYDTHKPIWFMIVSLFTGYLPWSIFLPAILVASVKSFLNSRRNSLRIYLWLWIAVAIGFFSFSRGKIDYYALPAFPACAMLTGYFLSKWIDEKNKLTTAAAVILNAAFILVGVGLALFLSALPFPPSIPPVTIGLIPALVGVLGLFQIFKGKKLFAAYATVFSGVVVTGSVFAIFAMPVITRLQPALGYAEQIKAHPEKTATIGMYDGIHHWIDEVTFRTEREPVKLASKADLDAFLAEPGPHWLMIKNQDFDSLDAETRNRLEVVARQGFVPKSITPSYIMKHRDNFTGGNELILARSK